MSTERGNTKGKGRGRSRATVERPLLPANSPSALDQIEARLGTVIENLAEGLIVVDANANALHWNRAALAMHGYEGDEDVLNYLSKLRDMYELRTVDGDVIPFEQWPIPRLLRGEQVRDYELVVRHRQRDWQRIFSYGGVLIDQHEPVIGLLTIRDVTDRRHAQRELLETQQRLERTQEMALVMALHVGLEGQWLKLPQRFCDFLGFTHEELIGTPFKDVTHPDDFESDWSQCLRLISGGIKSFEMEKRFIRKDGSVVWGYLNCSVVTDDYGRPVHFLTYVRDINAQKESEQESRRKQVRMSEAEALSHTGAWDWELANNRLTFSDEWLRIHGCSERNLTLERLMEIAHPDDRAFVNSVFEQAIKGLGPYDLEHRIVRQDTGEIRYIKARGKFVRDASGKALRVYGFAQDITEQKQGQEELRKAKEQYRLLVENQTDMVAQLTREGRRLYVNPNYVAFVGKTDAEILESDFSPEIHPEDIERVAEAWKKTFEPPSYHSEIEARTLTPNGWRWASWRNTAILDERGEPTTAICVGRDITKLKEAEEALKRSEERVRLKLASILEPDADISELEMSDIIDTQALQSLMEEFYRLTQIPVGILDLKGNVLVGVGWQEICTRFHRVDPRTCQFCLESDVELSMDVPRGEYKVYACKNNMWDVVTPIYVGPQHVGNVFLGQFFFEDEAPDREFFRQQAQRYNFDERGYMAALDKVPRLSREKLHVAMSYFMKLADMVSKLSYSNIKLARSLAERDSLTAALSESEERFRTLAELVPQLVWTADAQGMVDYVNERWTTYTGLPLERSRGQGSFAAVHPDDLIAVSESWAEAVAQGSTHEVEFRLLSRDGEYRWFLARGSPVRGHDGRIERWFGTCTDIHDFKQSQDALVRTEKLATVGRMAATIAHEINNPLESVMNSVYLAMTNPSATPDLREHLERAERELERVAHITRQTLGFYKETGAPRRVRVPELINGVLDLFAPKLVDKKIEVERRFATGLDVKVVPGELRQVVSNLVSNAMDAMSSPGKLAIRTSPCFSNGGDCPMVRLTVADSGSGIDAAHLKRIFEPFFTTKEAIGTGLGLWVSKEIVTKHGGWIRVRSRKGRGTVFSLCLPRASEGTRNERKSVLASV